MMSKALRAAVRPIVFSLCEWATRNDFWVMIEPHDVIVHRLNPSKKGSTVEENLN